MLRDLPQDPDPPGLPVAGQKCYRRAHAERAKSPSAMLKRLLRSQAVQLAAARTLGRYLAFALRTTRWTIDGEEHFAPHAVGRPCVAAFWHECLPLMPMLWTIARRRGSPARAHVLVSRHRDGRFIGEVIRCFRVELVHGSTANAAKAGPKGGPAGVLSLIGVLARGDLVVMTPDGPRGPRRKAAPGVAQIAALAGVPVLPAGAQTTRRTVLRSWDRMVLPLPFGRGVIVCGAPIAVPRQGWEATLPVIEAAMNAASDRADALCKV